MREEVAMKINLPESRVQVNNSHIHHIKPWPTENNKTNLFPLNISEDAVNFGWRDLTFRIGLQSVRKGWVCGKEFKQIFRNISDQFFWYIAICISFEILSSLKPQSWLYMAHSKCSIPDGMDESTTFYGQYFLCDISSLQVSYSSLGIWTSS